MKMEIIGTKFEFLKHYTVLFGLSRFVSHWHHYPNRLLQTDVIKNFYLICFDVMDLDTLKKIIKKGESETLEFKTSTAEKYQIGETLCALLNHHKGGLLLIGVRTDGRVIGQSVSDATLQELAQTIRQIDPLPKLQPAVIPLEKNKKLIVFHVKPHKDDIPFVYKGRPFIRVSATTSIMPRLHYQKLLLEHMHDKVRWEKFETKKTWDDLDKQEIMRMINSGINLKRIPSFEDIDIPSIFEKLELTINGALTNAAVVLFGKDSIPGYIQCQVKLARFKGTDKTEFLDERTCHGNAFFLLEQAMDFLYRHIPIRKRIESGKLERVEEPLIPFSALREALINAICHRDYSEPRGSISLAIFDDRVEIWSYGSLHTELTTDKLKIVHKSYPHNPNIAMGFYLRGLIESWGRGTNKMVEVCQEAEVNEPKFVAQDYHFGVFFFAKIREAPATKWDHLTPQKRIILAEFEKKPALTLKELISKLPYIQERALRQELETLGKLKIIQPQGRGRAAFWKIINNKP